MICRPLSRDLDEGSHFYNICGSRKQTFTNIFKQCLTFPWSNVSYHFLFWTLFLFLMSVRFKKYDHHPKVVCILSFLTRSLLLWGERRGEWVSLIRGEICLLCGCGDWVWMVNGGMESWDMGLWDTATILTVNKYSSRPGLKGNLWLLRLLWMVSAQILLRLSQITSLITVGPSLGVPVPSRHTPTHFQKS